MSDVFGAVLFFYVLDDFAAAVFAEIDVDIGRFSAVEVEEAFEEQIEFEWADVAEVERIGDERTDAGATGGGGDVVLASVADEVPDDEEIVGEAQGVDDVELVVEPFDDWRGQFAIAESLRFFGVAILQADDAEFAEIFGRRFAFGRREVGEVAFAEFELDVHAVGDQLALFERFVEAGEGGVHFGRAAEMELIGFHPHAVGVGAELAGVDAEHDVLGVGIFLIDVVGIAGGDEGDAHLAGDFDGAFHLAALDFDAVVLNFDEVAVAE